MRTFDDFVKWITPYLVDLWLEGATLDRVTVEGFLAHGIPAEWATAIETASKGRLPASGWPKVIHPPKLFHTRSQKSSTVEGNVNATAKLNMSRRRSDDPFVKTIRNAKPKGFTQNGLAKRLKIPPSLLSMYRTKQRQIPKHRADEIHALTGWPADLGGWPGGIVSGD